MKTPEQQTREILKRIGAENAQSLTAEGVTLDSLARSQALLREVLQYVEQAHNEAEARHDNPDGEGYMDGSLYETIRRTSDLLKRIEDVLRAQGGDGPAC